MKAILIICLIASLNCNIFDVGMCLFSNGKIRSVVSEIFTAIKEKNWENVLSIAISNFEEVKTNAINCFDEEPVLQFSFSECRRCILKNIMQQNKCIQICQKIKKIILN